MKKISQNITCRDSESVDLYFNEIRRIPLLTPEEEVELARKAKNGDLTARNKLVEGNLRFVVSVANQFKGVGVCLSDLIQEGNLGIIKAAERFDETRGFKFISYAVNWIYQSISAAIAKQGRMVRLPQNKLYAQRKIAKASSRLEQQHHRLPTLEEIAEVLQLPEDTIAELMQLSSQTVSLNATLDSESDTTVEEVLVTDNYEPADKNLMRQDTAKVVDIVMSDLPESECSVLRLLNGIGTNREYTLEEIAAMLNLSGERVRQLKEKGLKRLRTNQDLEILRQYRAA